MSHRLLLLQQLDAWDLHLEQHQYNFPLRLSMCIVNPVVQILHPQMERPLKQQMICNIEVPSQSSRLLQSLLRKHRSIETLELL